MDAPRVFDRILNMEDAARVAGLSSSRLRWLAERGRFPSARRVGQGWAVLESDIRDFITRERRPGRPWLLRGNTLFANLPGKREDWLVYRSKAVLAEPDGRSFRIFVIGLDNTSWSPDGFTEIDWNQLVAALENWAAVVEHVRRVPVERRWTGEPITERETLAEVDPAGSLDLAAYLVGAAMPELSEWNRWVNLAGRGVVVAALLGGAWDQVNVIARDLKTGWIQVQWPPQEYVLGPGDTVPLNIPRLWLAPGEYEELEQP